MTTVAPNRLSRLYLSPGPIYDAGAEPDPWRFARALHAAGFRKGDILHNCFSYHLTPAGMMVDSAARAIGCAVFSRWCRKYRDAGSGSVGSQAGGLWRNPELSQDHSRTGA